MLLTNSGFADAVESITAELPNLAHDRVLLTDGQRRGFRDCWGLKAAASDREPEGEPGGGEDPRNIICSSGTSGRSKGIVHTHRVRAAYAASFAAAFRITPESVSLHAGSIVFNGAFDRLMLVDFTGRTYVLLSHFDPSPYVETITREKVSM